MSTSDTHPKRPYWRFFLAVLAVGANMVLPAAWSQAALAAHPSGDAFPICHAKGGDAPAGHRPADPADHAACILHCSIYLFSGNLTGPTGSAATVIYRDDRPTVISYEYSEPAFTRRVLALKFDARAPPA
jgi:hypothetical protein